MSDTDAQTEQRSSLAPPVDRVRLEALRYAVNEESAQYIAVMRTFTGGLSGLLSDRSATEVATALAEEGIELDTDTTDARLSYLVEHGNLARSPRETEARSLRDYLLNRARYQLTQRGELVHRQIEDLLGYSESAREVSSEMLGGIQAGLAALDGYDDAALAAADPDVLAREIGTLFAQFERLVQSTREFYTYLTQVLSRFDLDRGEFQAFKSALLDYLQRFVDEISRYMPQIADILGGLAPRVPFLCERANAGQRLLEAWVFESFVDAPREMATALRHALSRLPVLLPREPRAWTLAPSIWSQYTRAARLSPLGSITAYGWASRAARTSSTWLM